MRQEQASSASKSASRDINYLAPAGERRRALGNMVFATEKLLLSRMMRAIGNPPVKIVLWNGQGISIHEGSEIARALIRDRGALLKLATDPELYFGELYSAQRIEVQGNLLDFPETVYRAWPLHSQGKIGKKLLATFYDARRNTLSGARRNIHHHYDIGNDFYELWLYPATVSYGIRRHEAGILLNNKWLTRHVVLDRWFLHTRQALIQAD